MSATYRVVPGSFSVTPTQTSYKQGEEVALQIKCQLQRKNGTGAWFSWSSDYKVYDKSDKLLAQDSREHFASPTTDIDTADDDLTIPLGTFTAGLLEGYVVVSAHG